MKTKGIKEFRVGIVRESEVDYLQLDGNSTRAIVNIATNSLGLHREIEEYVYVFCLDKLNKVTGMSEVSHGNINSSIVDPRAVFTRALLGNARGIILVHNHPSGDTTPSNADIEITKRLRDAGIIMGINFIDHIIIGSSGSYESMKEYGII